MKKIIICWTDQNDLYHEVVRQITAEEASSLTVASAPAYAGFEFLSSVIEGNVKQGSVHVFLT